MARRVGFGEEGDAAPPGPRKIQRVPIIFLSIWLIFWTGAIFTVAGLFIDSGATPNGIGTFFIAWLVIAIIGWLFAVRTLLRLIQGKPIGRGKRASPAEHPGRLPHDPDDR